MKDIKILCITRKYPPQIGGMENFSYNLLTGLEKIEGVKTKTISLGKTQKHLIWFFPYACVYVLLNAAKYDVIFIGDAVLCFAGILSKMVSPGTKRIINVFGLDLTFKNPLYQFYLKLFYEKCSDLYISISKGTDEVLHKRGIGNSIIITPGVPVGNMSAKTEDKTVFKLKYHIPEDHLVMLTVGRLVKRKGVEWFIRNVMPQIKDEKISYFVIGDGKERDNIRYAWEQCSASSNVHLLGKVDQEVLNDFYRYSDLFIMPNVVVEGDKEGFGIVAAEASMAGLIVLAAGIEGIQDAISDGKNGYLLKSEDAEGFKEKIMDIYNNYEKYDHMRKVFASYTQKHYNWDYICEQYVLAIKRLLIEEKR